MYYYICIALTGAIVLGIEVLASRVQTPYFGVSLYIWASILTVTLICLALGYYYGGRLTRTRDVRELKSAFSTCIALGSVALTCSALAYSHVFPILMDFNLILGSLIASVFLMGIPLILFSALNPIVIVLVHQDSGLKGDAGAGLVFFISTLGSVLGVVVTAFVFIPQISNTVGLELFSLFAAMLAVSSLIAGDIAKTRALIVSLVAIIASVGALVLDVGFKKTSFVDREGVAWRILDERHSIFGNIRVAERGEGDDALRYYLTDGLTQGVIRHDGSGGALFSYAIESLLQQYAANSNSILFLGLAAGIVPRSFDSRRYHTEIVEINEHSVEIAKQHFGLDLENRIIHIQDARTFVNKCKGRFDAIVFDMFNGDGVPEYLLSREFFEQVRQCGTDDAVVVMNFFVHKDEQQVRNAIFSTVHSVFPVAGYFSDEASGGEFWNGFIVASNGAPEFSKLGPISVPAYLAKNLSSVLRSGRMFSRSDYGSAKPLIDDHNIYPVISANMNMRFRQSLRKQIPIELFKS